MKGFEIIEKYFPETNEDIKSKFRQLKELYEEWNLKINVISRKDIDQLYERHVLHSLGIAKVIKFKAKTKVLDVGTGGGFPGIPLAIFFPETEFTLIDSIAKKIKVVNEVSNSLGLKNCKAYQSRAEKVEGKFDFVVSRAVKPLPIVNHWIGNKISKDNKNDLPNGILYLKGGNFTDELVQLKSRYRVYELSEFFEEEFFETKKVAHLFI